MVEAPDEDSLPERHGWRPRHPDPALVDPDAAGLRAHRYPPNRLHPFVFMQEDVWVDYLGNELELSSMSAPHVRNLLAFTRGQAARIREMVDPDLALDQLPALVAGLASDPDLVRDAEAGYNRGAIASLERTPLVRALQALAAITDTTDDDGTAS